MDLQEQLRRASAARAQGEWAAARRVYEGVLAQAPNLPNTWFNLGIVCRHMGDPRAALAAYAQALRLGVEGAEEAHLNRAVIFADDLLDAQSARLELESALRVRPTFLPALLNLANLAEDFGRREEAVALYERALKIDPRAYEALARLANCLVVNSIEAPIIGRLRNALLDKDSAPEERASLGFALGRALDAAAAYDDAFDAYQRANFESRAGAVDYDRAAHDNFVTRIIQAFPAPAPKVEDVGEPPIFICGMFRSGSTLIERVLARHPKVTAAGEIGYFSSRVLPSVQPFPEAAAARSARGLKELARGYLDALRHALPNAAHITDKRPDNFLYVGLIKAMFPSARIVHTTRNALDNCLAVYFLHLDRGMTYAFDLDDIGHYLAQERRLMSHWRKLYPESIFDFDYDAFVQAPAASLEPLLTFCGLDWDEACLTPGASGGPVKTPSAWQVREAIYKRSSGRWKNYEGKMQSLLQRFPLQDAD
jgi:tetratricopeptide (TPR) repeat protein